MFKHVQPFCYFCPKQRMNEQESLRGEEGLRRVGVDGGRGLRVGGERDMHA